MRILYVCTANICRSALAEQMLLDSVAAVPELSHVEVLSAGTDAILGRPGCPMVTALAGNPREHLAQPLTADLVHWADLIMPASRDHRLAISELDLASRSRTFTIRQAGRLADWLLDSGMVAAARERAAALGLSSRTAGTDRFTPGDPRRDVEPFPDERELITRWVVAEMNAARGATAVPGQPGGPPLPSRLRRVLRRSWRRSAPGFGPPPEHVSAGAFGPGEGRFADHLGPHPDDIADPHVLGGELHSLAFEQIRSSTDSLIRLLREVHERT